MIDQIGMRLSPIFAWVSRLAWINLLWIGFTVVGLGLFGFFPATIAMYSVVRQWMMRPESRDESTVRAFAAEFKKELLSANALGWLVVLVGVALYFNLSVTIGLSGYFYTAIFYLSVAASAVYLTTLVQLPFIYVHVSARRLSLVKYAWLYSMAHPFGTAIIVGVGAGLSFLFGAVPALVPFCSGSIVCAITVAFGLRGLAPRNGAKTGKPSGAVKRMPHLVLH